MRANIPELEGCLRAWEDRCWIFKASARLLKQSGLPGSDRLFRVPAIRNFANFRQGMLDASEHNRLTQIGEFCFGMQPTPGDMGFGKLGVDLDTFAFCCLDWSRYSRRVYTISDVLQGQLLMTSLRERTWTDVQLPFPCFCVRPAQPLQPPSGEKVSLILVNQHRASRSETGSTDHFMMYGLTEANLTYRRLTNTEKAAFDRHLERRQLSEAQNLLRKWTIRCTWYGSSYVLGIDPSTLDLPIETTMRTVIDPAPPDEQEFWTSTARLVFGFCLYMRSMPNRLPPIKVWVAPPPRGGQPDRHAVTNPEEVTSVDTYHQFDPEEREELVRIVRLGGGQYELRSKWVEGHTRRPPGQGSDPTAPKIVVVQPYMRRRDRLPPHSLPGGSEKSADVQ